MGEKEGLETFSKLVAEFSEHPINIERHIGNAKMGSNLFVKIFNLSSLIDCYISETSARL